jgi:hypothetical protein
MKISTLVLILVCISIGYAQTITSFEGIDASQVSNPEFDVDPNGAVGTKQYMEWVNVYYQAYDKVTFTPVWSTPQIGTTPWHTTNMSSCYGVGGDSVIIFDRLASRWVVSARTSGANGSYYYCVAVSNTDDLASGTLAWYTYAWLLNPILGTNSLGHTTQTQGH